MEENRKDAGTPTQVPSVADSPANEAPTSSRRRGGSQKRKASALGSGGTSAPATSSSKRQAREKPPAVPFPPIHNGPLTRARQQPNNTAATAVAASLYRVKIEGEEVPRRGVAAGETARAEEFNWAVKEDLEALESKIEADYEAIRSRDANVHVVPNHAGWFSWTKFHSLEEKTLPSFFSGKLEGRTPEIYMEIRNMIMKKFHSNPCTNIELRDLSEISISDLEARQEVMEFLDYWGLINYHPFPKTDPSDMSIDGDADTLAKTNSVVESLFRFESEQSFTPVVPRNSMATAHAPSGLFPDSTIAEELVKSEEPEVEYHCNSCSADCSRKRYHCQKQADFDLCTDCFNNGKFGSDMSPSDFILMEPAEASAASSGKWTDQETLLLLEALELFKENWNEIAEHVATKTKAQCILHFVQMPIEDMFLDGGDEIDSTAKDNADTVPTDDTAATKDVTEMAEIKDNADNNQLSSSPSKSSKPEEVNGSKVGEVCENFAIKAITEAFEAVGSLPSPGGHLSFTEADNPVMTLAALLVGLVKPNVANASARSSLKFISGNSFGEQLAARHCFVLEDPPDEKNSADSKRIAAEIIEEESQKDEEQDVEKQESKLVAGGVSASVDDDNESNKDSVIQKERPLASPIPTGIEEPASAREYNETDTHEVLEPALESVSDNAVVPKEQVPSIAEDSNDLTMEVEIPPGFEKEPEDGMEMGETSETAEAPKEKDMIPDPGNKDPVHTTGSNTMAENDANKGTGAEYCMSKEQGDLMGKIDIENNEVKKAALTALSAAAVKGKLLANLEEEQIHRLATLLIEKQLLKLEIKMAFFNEMENMVMRVREQLERSKQRLFHERAQIIAARLGISGSRPMQPTLPVNRASMIFAHSVPRPLIGVPSPRSPVSRPIKMSNSASGSFVPATVAGSSVQPSNPDQLSSVGTK